MGKTSKAMLVQAACLIESNEFWALRLEQYVNDIGPHKECETALEAACGDLEEGDMSVTEQMGKIMVLLQKLPCWRQNLRSICLAGIESKVQERILADAKDVVEKGNLLKLEALAPVFAEALIIFPLSEPLQRAHASLADVQAKKEQQGLATSLKELCGEAATLKEASALSPVVQKMVKLSKQLTGNYQGLATAVRESMTSTLEAVAASFSKKVTEEKPKDARVLVQWLHQGALILDLPRYKTLANYLDLGYELYYLDIVLNDEKHVTLPSLQSLRVACLQLKPAETGIEDDMDEDCKERIVCKAVQDFLADMEKFIGQEWLWWKERSLNKVNVSSAELAKELKKAAKWQSASSCKSLSAVLALAKESILSISPIQLEKLSNGLEEAGSILTKMNVAKCQLGREEGKVAWEDICNKHQ
eukprot:6488993-Amphidinium_carterae.3